MSDTDFRRTVRVGLAPMMEDIPEGPEWHELNHDGSLAPVRSTRFAWLAGLASAVVVMVVVGVAAFLGGGEDVPPPGTGDTPSAEWVAIDYPEGSSTINDLMIWADDRIILWGGQTAGVDESPTGEPGWSYNLNTAAWSPLPPSPKDPAIGTAGVWTGKEVIICCGTGEQFADFATTVAYNPETEEWRRLADAPISGSFSEAVWTGDEMLVVTIGGVAGYDPASDRWTTYPAPPEAARLNEIAWTGEELITWSRVVERAVHPGYALTLSTGEWSQLPDPPAWPAAPDIVWTGDRLVVWGGLPARSGGSERAVGSVYDPATNSWTPMSEALPEPDGCECNLGSQSMVWTGDRVLVSTGALGTGVDPLSSLLLAYDPSSDTWELVDQTLLPAIWPANVVLVGDPIVVFSDRVYISPYGWIPQGKPVTANSWTNTTTTLAATTTTQPLPPYMFVPTPQISQGDQATLPIAFLDGTTASMTWPTSLDLLSNGVGTSGWGAVNDLGSNSARDIIAIPEPREMVIDRFGTGEVLATYADGRGGLVQFRRFPVDTTVDYLVFDFGAWTVLVYDYQKNSEGRMTEASREIWSSHLSSSITADGFLVLVADAPLILAGAGESPPVALGFNPPGGSISMTLTPCVPNQTVEDEPNSLSWCNGSGEVSITVHSITEEFRNSVRASLVVSDIERP